MYESLTEYIPKLAESNQGEWVIDHENDGTPEHPIRWPWVHYEESVIKLERAMYKFIESHEDMGLRQYHEILEKSDIKWDMDSMSSADVSELDAVTVLALFLGAFRAERFCDGALLRFCESGCIVRWLQRLKEIDETDELK